MVLFNQNCREGWRGAMGCASNLSGSRLSPIKGSRCFLEQETLPSHCLVLVAPKNVFERDFAKLFVSRYKSNR